MSKGSARRTSCSSVTRPLLARTNTRRGCSTTRTGASVCRCLRSRRRRSRPRLRPLHNLRHSFASKLVEAGLVTVTVQPLLGHESIRTTQRCVHLTSDTQEPVRAVLEALDTLVTHAD
ncbi:MAG TPA: tyrosine-type recombinase/integrase [Polyangia bacterium]|nr:tyrosine-type recombinase/integrase [Polyangia bacterium]